MGTKNIFYCDLCKQPDKEGIFCRINIKPRYSINHDLIGSEYDLCKKCGKSIVGKVTRIIMSSPVNPTIIGDHR